MNNVWGRGSNKDVWARIAEDVANTPQLQNPERREYRGSRNDGAVGWGVKFLQATFFLVSLAILLLVVFCVLALIVGMVMALASL